MILAPGPPLTPKQKKTEKTPFTYPPNQSPRYGVVPARRRVECQTFRCHVTCLMLFFLTRSVQSSGILVEGFQCVPCTPVFQA